MNKSQQIYAVTAICLSIIMAGAIITYRPGAVDPSTTSTGPDFRFPTGVGVSSGLVPTLSSEAVPTLYNEEAQMKTISLSGAGSASATANQATISLGVEITSELAKDAIAENAELMTSIINAIQAQGVNEDDIQTTSYNVYAQYDWTEDGRVLRGYTVTNMVRVTIKDLDKVGDVIDVAGEAGSNQMGGISFELSDEKREEIKLNAYVAALEDARAKADVIAETLGITITGVQSVTESSYAPSRTYVDYEMAESSVIAGRAPTPIISGDLTVTVNVHIVYLFE
ncbi:MAG: SIMPL domain-containing protein [Candidatus Bathyarchaeota archaeon]|nr:SIMPL domain-containing protein [Candidatus Bathyarchaeota archaeon]